MDYVTFSGTGEPTLAANLGEALELVRTSSLLKGVPTPVLTNSSPISRPDVCRDLTGADLVAVKLDAPSEALFKAINRPIMGVTWTGVVDGIRAFRRQFRGRLALQMMFVVANRGVAREMADLAYSLDAGEIHINTPLRPSRTPPLDRTAMAEIEGVFAGLPVVSVFKARPPQVKPLDTAETQRRRPAEGHPETVGKQVS